MKSLLLVNIGTPASPNANEVGRFLEEFLMDPLVMEMPKIFRWILVKKIIVPNRKFLSSDKYKKIWTDRGSPLLFHGQDLVKAMQKKLPQYNIKLAMRYGQPNIEAALKEFKQDGTKRVKVFPLFPQYSSVTTKTVIDCVKKINEKFQMQLEFVESFADNKNFIEALKQITLEFLEGSTVDHYLFSFHGLPERTLHKHDPLKNHCLKKNNCCEINSKKLNYCYRSQCQKTAKILAQSLQLNKDQWTLSFQSRLQPGQWLKPDSQDVIQQLTDQGIKRIAVLTPSFVADCLESLEEIGMKLRDTFLQAGGEKLFLIPCLNSHPAWVQGLSQILDRRKVQ